MSVIAKAKDFLTMAGLDVPAMNVVLIEPFYGGSHKQLIDTLEQWLSKSDKHLNVSVITLPAKKWHWRARTSALYLSQVIPLDVEYHVLFSSSVLNLTELVALRPDLMRARKIVFFHENQLAYPVIHKSQNRDFQYGYNQITTCLIANSIIFNSNFNKDTFLNSINKFMKLQPDFRPTKIKEAIEPKCKVLYFPIYFPTLDSSLIKDDSKLHIIWPHRWEHDKDPETFFQALSTLVDQQKDFRLSILGERFSEIPPVFEEATIKFKNNIHHIGFLESKEEYFLLLQQGHVVVSTAKHEYYGVAMLESVYCGCFPLCPNNLVYPEIYPKQCLFNNASQLVKRLARFCDYPSASRRETEQLKIDFAKYSSSHLLPEYEALLTANIEIDSNIVC